MHTWCFLQKIVINSINKIIWTCEFSCPGPRNPLSQELCKNKDLWRAKCWFCSCLPSLRITSKILQNVDLFCLISFMQILFQVAGRSDNVITELNKNKGAGELVGTLGKGRCFPNGLGRDVGSEGAETTPEVFSPSVGMKHNQIESPMEQNGAKFSV